MNQIKFFDKYEISIATFTFVNKRTNETIVNEPLVANWRLRKQKINSSGIIDIVNLSLFTVR